jgi:hypothetical protein
MIDGLLENLFGFISVAIYIGLVSCMLIGLVEVLSRLFGGKKPND